jgi:hypothetical protein
MKNNIFKTKLFLTSARISLFESFSDTVENKSKFSKYIFDEASDSEILNILIGEEENLQEKEINMFINDLICEPPTLISDEVKVGILKMPIMESIILEFNSLLEYTKNYRKYKKTCNSKEGIAKSKCLLAARIQSVNEYIKYLSDRKREICISKKDFLLCKRAFDAKIKMEKERIIDYKNKFRDL